MTLKRNPIISQTDQNYSDVGVINQFLTLVDKGKLFPNINVSDEFAEQHRSQWRKFKSAHTDEFPVIADGIEQTVENFMLNPDLVDKISID